jgi:hypothetical protein
VKITLLPELFEPPIQNALLIALLSYPLDDRHHIDLDTAHPSIAAWFSAQSPGLREELELGLDLSVQAEALEPSRTTVQITGSGPPDFESDPLRVPLAGARQFLDSAFVILLEDANSDRAFLERMLTDQERDFLRRRIGAGAVRIDHGGGTGSTTRRVRVDATAPANRHLLWVLFDSDAMQPGQPTAASERLRAACGRIPHHQLHRRYAESYLTLRALEDRATNSTRPGQRETRLRHYRAFARMRDEQRHHYNMKEGFDGDAGRRDATAGQLYDALSDSDRRLLADGFGRDVNDHFADGSVTEADLRRDATGWAELRPVIVDLLARIR